MKKLLRKRDIFLLTLAGIGDVIEDVKDPLRLASSSYENMCGFVPSQYRHHNFSSLVGRSLRTGYVERVVRDNKAYLKLTSSGKNYIQREFPIKSLVKQWNKKWIIVIFDIKETSRRQRNQLRDRLKNIGFGMLQQSTWITPLPIREDMREFIASQDFSNNVFVLEVSDVLLGDSETLAARVWNLDKLEEEYLNLKEEKEKLVQSIKTSDGRHKKRYSEIEGKIREQARKILEFLVTLPPLPRELFPASLKEAIAA